MPWFLSTTMEDSVTIWWVAPPGFFQGLIDTTVILYFMNGRICVIYSTSMGWDMFISFYIFSWLSRDVPKSRPKW
jgi:energy-converting hydrogenase Eha subunit F